MGNKEGKEENKNGESVYLDKKLRRELELNLMILEPIETPEMVKKLPKVLLVYIFLKLEYSHFTKLILVCRSFRHIIYNTPKLAV